MTMKKTADEPPTTPAAPKPARTPEPRREDYTAEEQAGVVVNPTPTRTDDSQTVLPAPAIPGKPRQTH